MTVDIMGHQSCAAATFSQLPLFELKHTFYNLLFYVHVTNELVGVWLLAHGWLWVDDRLWGLKPLLSIWCGKHKLSA